MSLPWVGRVVNSTAPTSTGTKDFTAFGMESCAGAMVICTWATADETQRRGSARSTGFTDGTTTFCSYGYSRDAVTTSVAKNSGNNTDVIRLKNPTDGTSEVIATFDSFITTVGAAGIRLDFTTVGDAVQIKVILFGGDNCECHAWRTNGTVSPATTITTGFLVDFNLTEVQRSNNDTINNNQHWQPGFSHRDGAVPNNGVMCSIDHIVDENVTTSDSVRGKSTQMLGQNWSFGSSSSAVGFSVINTYTSTGFDVEGNTSFPGTNGPVLIGLAVKVSSTGDPVSVASSVDRTGAASTGNQTITFAGFKAGMILVPTSGHQTNNSRADFSSIAYGFSDFINTGAVQLRERHNVTTTDNASGSHERVFDLFNHRGNVHLHQSDAEAQLPSGFSINWSIVPGTVRRYGVIVIEEFPIKATFGATQASPSASFQVLVPFRATFGATQGSPTATFTAKQVFKSTFGATQGSPTASVAALQIFRATFGATQAAALASNWVATQQALTFGAIQASATGSFAVAQVLRAVFGAVQGSPVASVALSQVFRATFGAVQGSPVTSFTLSTSVTATLTFAAVQGSPVASVAVKLELRLTFGAVQGPALPTNWALVVPVGAVTLTFSATQAPAFGLFIVRRTSMGTRTCLDAARMARSMLTASQVARTALQGTRRARADLLASSVSTTALLGAFQERTALSASHNTPTLPSATRTALAASHVPRLALAAEHLVATPLSGDYDQRSALLASRITRTNLAGSRIQRVVLAAAQVQETC